MANGLLAHFCTKVRKINRKHKYFNKRILVLFEKNMIINTENLNYKVLEVNKKILHSCNINRSISRNLFYFNILAMNNDQMK